MGFGERVEDKVDDRDVTVDFCRHGWGRLGCPWCSEDAAVLAVRAELDAWGGE